MIDETQEPQAEEARETAGEEQAEDSRGPLLDLPPEQAAQLATELWNGQTPTLSRQIAQWEANKLRRQGRRDVQVIKDEDANGWRVYQPVITIGTPAYPGRADETIGEILSALLVDEPKPAALPAQDSDEDRDAAEFAGRVLEIETGESGLNLRAKLYDVADTAAVTASGFLHWWVDPYGGGHEARQVRAHPLATTEDEAATGPMGAEPVASGDYVLRYVQPDGTLSETSAGAVRQWRPQVVGEVLTAHQVRFVPYTRAGIEACDGVLLARPVPWGQLVAQYPEVGELDEEATQQVLGWSLPREAHLFPDGQRRKKGQMGKDGKPRADALVLTLTVYMRPSLRYPNGAHACFVGGKYRVSGDDWMLRWTDAQGREHEEMRDLPVAQVRWKPDNVAQSPYGRAVMDDLGPIEELLASFDGGIQQLIFQALNPNVLVPIGSVIQPEAWGRRDGTPISFNAGAGQPVVEAAPNIPAFVFDRVAALEQRMDRASGSAPSLRGLTSPNVTSGEQEKTIIEQALVMVSNLRHALEDCYERSCRIILQHWRVHMTAPQMVRYLGEDGGFKYDEWTGADLGSVQDVRVRKGTFTMLAPTARAAYIDQLVAGQMLPLEKAARLKRGAVDYLTGEQDDAHYLRVKRQIRRWKDGPSEEATQAAAQYEAMPPEPQPSGQVDPMTGQPMMAPPPPHPVLAEGQQVFAPLPCDAEPLAARTRLLELSECMAGASFATYPAPWRQAYVEAYEAARQAAGLQTVAEQQQAAQQQAEAQQQAAAGQQQAKAQDAEAQHARDLQKLEVRAAQADDRDARKLARDLEREAMSAAAGVPQPMA